MEVLGSGGEWLTTQGINSVRVWAKSGSSGIGIFPTDCGYPTICILHICS